MNRIYNYLSKFLLAIGLGFFAITCAIGCTSSEQVGYYEIVEEGILVKTYYSAVAPLSEPFQIEFSTVFGLNQSDSTYYLNRPSVIGISSIGEVFIIDRPEAKIHRFASGGSQLSSFGRFGEGPGELTNPFYSLIINDSLWVWDNRSVLAIFSTDGELLSTQRLSVRLRGSLAPIGSQLNPHLLQILQRTTIGSSDAMRTYQIQLIESDLSNMTTLIDSSFVLLSTQFGRRNVVQPFQGKTLRFALAPFRPLAMSWGDSYRIDFVQPVTSEHWAIRLPVQAKPVTRELKEKAIEQHEGAAERYGDKDLARKNLRFPAVLPYVGNMFWDELGRLWVSDYSPFPLEPQIFHFRVFDSDGTWLFEQNLPNRPDLITSSGYFTEGEDSKGNPLIQYYRFLPK